VHFPNYRCFRHIKATRLLVKHRDTDTNKQKKNPSETKVAYKLLYGNHITLMMLYTTPQLIAERHRNMKRDARIATLIDAPCQIIRSVLEGQTAR
jgi:hypothetical protein